MTSDEDRDGDDVKSVHAEVMAGDMAAITAASDGAVSDAAGRAAWDPSAWVSRGAALLADLIRQSQDAHIISDFAGHVRDMNPAAERLYACSIDEARGENVHDLLANRFPEGREAYEASLLREGHWAGEILQCRRNGTEIVVSSRQTLHRGLDGESDLVLASNRDISEQYHASHRLQSLFDSHVVGVIYWNLDTGQITDANDTFLNMVGYTHEDLEAGRLNFREMTPPEWLERNEKGVESIRKNGSAPTYEKEYLRKDGSRVPILIGGTRFENSGADGFSFVIDNTERRSLHVEQERLYAETRNRAEREALLSDASRLLNSSLDYNDTLATVARLIVPRFADWCAVDVLDDQGEPQRVAVEHVDPAKAAWGWELVRRYPMRKDDERGVAAVLRNGEPSFIPRITGEMLAASITDPERLRLIQDIGFTSAMIVPLAVRDKVFGALSLISTTESGRIFSEEDLRFAQDLGQRAGLAVENARLFRVTQQRAEREALLNRIGEAVRGALEPEAILEAIVSALGEGLGADRCYFARYNKSRDIARASPEWIRPGLTIHSIAGRDLQMSRFSVDRDESYKTGATHVVDDVVEYDPGDADALLSVDIRALLRVPIEVGDQMTALAVSMAHEPRHWTGDEINLVENVAALLHAALESALVQKRERNIAQQLQDALVPSSPPSVPGLSIAHFYRPALEEAGVGGDFFDVFDVCASRTALVVADLSGKGLAAASQVAIVRNMLRFALYDGESAAEAINKLHRVLVANSLLTGFATLFVGLFDHNERTLTYVNCGQEPSLLIRAEPREAVRLNPTGPVLGGFLTEEFQQKTVLLRDGDVIAMFTDGLTEVGPSRKNLLEVEGVCDLLLDCFDAQATTQRLTSQFLIQRLIAGVDDFARGGIGDDIAVLVALVTDEPTSFESGV